MVALHPEGERLPARVLSLEVIMLENREISEYIFGYFGFVTAVPLWSCSKFFLSGIRSQVTKLRGDGQFLAGRSMHK